MAGPLEPQFIGPRRRLTETLRTNGVSDPRVLAAFEATPRHLFVPTGVRHRAYEDSPLPIGSGQTISQPSIHGRYLQLLELTGSERVLEIGTGSGYQTMLLSQLADQVFSIERIGPLLDGAREILQRMGARNVSLLHGDGTVGWRDYAPYHAVLVSAASPSVPAPLMEQLADGGRLLVPVGSPEEQTLVMVTRNGSQFEHRNVAPVRFVPLLGAHGWTE